VTAIIPIEQALLDKNLLGAGLGDPTTWAMWFTTVKAAYGRPLTSEERELFATVSGGRQVPTQRVRELVAIISRRSGKGRIAGALITHAALLSSHDFLSPGEVPVAACISPTRAQAMIVKDYVKGYITASPLLRGELVEETQDELRLRNGVVIATLAADYRSLRGRTLLIACLDEASFLRDESSATPDLECARALLPGLMTSGGLLVTLSSPYRRRGLVWQRYKDSFGQDDPNVLVVTGPSVIFNPTIRQDAIDAACDADPEGARSEWLGEFRVDVGSFLDDPTIEAAIDYSRPQELPPRSGFRHYCFIDPSGGRHDSMTCVVAHEENGRFIADVVRGRAAPFDPQSVTAEFAQLARAYNCREVWADNYAAEWPVQAFAAEGVTLKRCELSKSALALEVLPYWAQGKISIPNHSRLLQELRLLERRTSRVGKDIIDHGPGGHDDFANALFGAIRLAAGGGAKNGMVLWSTVSGWGAASRLGQPIPAHVVHRGDDGARARAWQRGSGVSAVDGKVPRYRESDVPSGNGFVHPDLYRSKSQSSTGVPAKRVEPAEGGSTTFPLRG
jgi:hypothetical protein